MNKSKHLGRKVRSRGARGRERDLGTAREPRSISAVLDAIAQSRATKEPLERALGSIIRRLHLGSRERKEAHQLAFAHARWRTASEAALAEAQKKYGGVKPRVRDMDRAAVFLSALTTDRDDLADAIEIRAPSYELLCQQAKSDGVFAVLRGHARLPKWIRTRIEKKFGADTDDEIDALLSRGRAYFATHEGERDDVLARLQADGVDAATAKAPRSIVTKHIAKKFMHDGIWPMDLGSQWISEALGVAPGDRVLDLCAGGGNKSRYLERDDIEYISLDIDDARLERTRGARVYADGRQTPFVDGYFDRVLVDAPCTGTGTLRRSPDLLFRLDESAIKNITVLQKELLQEALRLVKVGGTLVYATCSLLSEENDEVVDAVVDDRFEPETIPNFDVARIWLTPRTHKTDGFFLARYKRV